MQSCTQYSRWGCPQCRAGQDNLFPAFEGATSSSQFCFICEALKLLSPRKSKGNTQKWIDLKWWGSSLWFNGSDSTQCPGELWKQHTSLLLYPKNTAWDNIVMAQGQQQLMGLHWILSLVLRNNMWQEEFDTEQLLKIYSFSYLFRQESSIFFNVTIAWNSSYLNGDRRYNGHINTFKIT